MMQDEEQQRVSRKYPNIKRSDLEHTKSKFKKNAVYQL